VNPMPYGEQARIIDRRPIRPTTLLAVLVSEKDPHASDGASLLFHRLRDARFPRRQIRLIIARSHGTFVAAHLAPLSSSPAARAAYWAPTDDLLAGLR
jgi:hypothetical protein